MKNKRPESKSIKYFDIPSETKESTNAFIKKGICAVMGNIDSWDDRIHPGAFVRSLNSGRQRVRHLWNHQSGNPPIASIKELKEVGRDELPADVLKYAPEATGGLLVEREYYKNNPLSQWVLEGINKGDITEMSFAYDVLQADETVEVDEETEKRRVIRELRELKLYDTSDVNWGMNAATVAAGAKNAFVLEAMPLGRVTQNLIEQIHGKQFSDFNDSDQELLKSIFTAFGSLEIPAEHTKTETEIEESESAIDNAEGVADGTSLLQRKFQVSQLEFESIIEEIEHERPNQKVAEGSSFRS